MQIAVASTAGECAATVYDQTVIPAVYLDRTDEREGCDSGERGTGLVRDLTDTLSHEWTHYEASTVNSTDADVKDDYRYVSYGIGCLTENVAVAGDDCPFDPSRHEPFTVKRKRRKVFGIF